MRLTLPGYTIIQKAEKSKTIQVRGHVRRGKPVKPHPRVVTGFRKVDFHVLHDINSEIEKNIAYLVYIAKVISNSHGIPIQFESGQPTGCTADLFAEGRMGMLLGGIEWENRKDKKLRRFIQMKTRARLNMLKMAKKLSSQIKRPRDFHIHYSIINNMIEKLTQEKGGYPPTPEDVADKITLMKRTRDGRRELNYTERLQKVYEIAKYGSRYEMNTDWEIMGDRDIGMWTERTIEERQLQRDVRRVLSGLLDQGILSPEQYEVIKKRYYLGNKQLPKNPRTFQRIADMIWDENKPRQVRKKVGDFYRYTPKSKKGKKYKTPVYTQITKVIKKPKAYFLVKMRTSDKQKRIEGLPPFRKRVKVPTVHNVIETHANAVEIIKPYLEYLIPLMKKSVVEKNRIAEWIGKDIKLFTE